MIVVKIGKAITTQLGIFVSFSATWSCRSFLVVRIFITGGIIIGTNDIYEYATTVIGPNKWGANFDVTKIEVGPSAAPITPILAASGSENPKNLYAIKPAIKIPPWATIPNSNIHGRCKSGLKSIIAPTHIKIKSGNTSVIIPASKRIFKIPFDVSCCHTISKGRFTNMAPNPMGSNNIGSYFFAIAR